MNQSVVPAHRIARSALVLAAILGLFSGGCDLWGPELTVECDLPATPASWAASWGEPSYLVVVTEGPGPVGEYRVPPGARRIGIVLPKEGTVSIVAYPWWDDGPGVAPGESMCPAGAVWPIGGVWPIGSAESRLELTYETGFVAQLIARVLSLSPTGAEFNVSRLIAEVTARVGPDPWCADVDSIVAAISSGHMRADYIRPEPTESFDIELPEGMWHRRSPFSEPIAGGVLTIDLRTGISVLYDTSGRRALFQVDDDGRCWWTVNSR